MRVANFTEVRKNLSSMIDQVNDDHTPLYITRGSGKPSAVLVSAEDFASWQETDYLTRNPANLKELRAALAEVEAGKAVERKLAD